LGVFVLLTFRVFLNEQHDFHKADRIILILVACNAASFAIGILGLLSSLERAMAAAALAALLIYNVVNLLLAARLLALKQDPFGLLRPFVYLTGSASVLALTVLLLPLGLLASMGALIVMGMILLRAREDVEIL
jgi:hypothetical protein